MTKPAARIGVIGDVHAEHERLALALDHLSQLHMDTIICTGDIVDGVGLPNDCIDLLKAYGVVTVKGNHDRWILQGKARHVPDAHVLEQLTPASRLFLTELPTQVEVPTTAGKLLLCHGVGDDDLKKVWPGTERMALERSRALDEIIRDGEFEYLVNGHMHFRTMIHFSDLTLINAGTLRGEHWPGFSYMDLAEHTITAFEFKESNQIHTKSLTLSSADYDRWTDTQAFTGGWDPLRLF